MQFLYNNRGWIMSVMLIAAFAGMFYMFYKAVLFLAAGKYIMAGLSFMYSGLFSAGFHWLEAGRG